MSVDIGVDALKRLKSKPLSSKHRTEAKVGSFYTHMLTTRCAIINSVDAEVVRGCGEIDEMEILQFFRENTPILGHTHMPSELATWKTGDMC
ncbi:hypothetical protein CYMTET_25457 [Cymbomonas tetramitiformis]|uniref:Uncharacterized protein n=1 Tax=Cymbomonas tetramitiformis TaxID=36881 RepID=A0AAE0KYX9_9CHLO|nr:hypothetical protein CYMTET_25457 [Cymbomonas tetramitiformis]